MRSLRPTRARCRPPGPGIDFVLMDMDSDGDLDLSDRHGQIGMNITITQGCEEESTGSQTDLVLNVSPNPFSVCLLPFPSGRTSCSAQ